MPPKGGICVGPCGIRPASRTRRGRRLLAALGVRPLHRGSGLVAVPGADFPLVVVCQDLGEADELPAQ